MRDMASQHPSSGIRLVLCFTRGMSLQAWEQAGILDREVALYRVLQGRVDDIAFLSYGGRDERRFNTTLAPIRVLPNTWRLGSNLYSVLAPLFHAHAMRRATIVKTNQLNGAWTAVLAKWWFHKPLVVRCGYLWSVNFERVERSAWKRWLVRWMERMICRLADRIIVATEPDRQFLITRYGIPRTHIRVIPNYVDTRVFCPRSDVPKETGLVCVVGRLGEEKNLETLLEAFEELQGMRLQVIGDGPLRMTLEARARAKRLPVEFLGVVPHQQLPALLNRAELFILPSRYEGHPKALLEAMACGLPVIGTKVPGIETALVHRRTGYLCGTTASELREAIRVVMRDPTLRHQMGTNARSEVVAHCSLDRVAEQELAVYHELLGHHVIATQGEDRESHVLGDRQALAAR